MRLLFLCSTGITWCSLEAHFAIAEKFNLTFPKLEAEWTTQRFTHLTPTHNIGSTAQHVDDLSFAFIAPLSPQYNRDFAIVVGNRATSFAITYQSAVCVVYIIYCTIYTCWREHCEWRKTWDNRNRRQHFKHYEILAKKSGDENVCKKYFSSAATTRSSGGFLRLHQSTSMPCMARKFKIFVATCLTPVCSSSHGYLLETKIPLWALFNRIKTRDIYDKTVINSFLTGINRKVIN